MNKEQIKFDIETMVVLEIEINNFLQTSTEFDQELFEAKEKLQKRRIELEQCLKIFEKKEAA